MSEKSYINDSGDTVFTSHYLKAKGTCCRSACLHCPFGFTIKKCGLTFAPVDLQEVGEINNVLSEYHKSTQDLTAYAPENIKWILLKDVRVGILTQNHIVIKEMYLKKHFKDQGIFKELVESYLF